ncbi:MAG: helix-turn-helix domain-containing protein, partial [Oscillospiraceae bacterium]|nr:helix-turn-helix domain-containing protein [Oscillospiraceae bacterium]
MFFDTFCQLCKNKGVSPNGVAKELSIASGTVSEWKKGRVPQNATLLKIADYFGVPADTLLEGEGNSPEDARLISLKKTL